MTGTVNTNDPLSAVQLAARGGTEHAGTEHAGTEHAGTEHAYMLEHYYGKLHNHCLQAYSQINNHMVSGESIIDVTLLLTTII